MLRYVQLPSESPSPAVHHHHLRCASSHYRRGLRGDDQRTVARHAATLFGEDAYPDLAGKVAAMMHSIVRSHPFLDGNKRTGWVAARLMTRLNGHAIALSENEAFDLVVELATADTEVPALAKRLKVEPIA